MADSVLEQLERYSDVVTDIESILDAYDYAKCPEPMRYLITELRAALSPVCDVYNVTESPESDPAP